MTPELETLWALHGLDERLVAATTRLAALPAERLALDARVLSERRRLEQQAKAVADFELRDRQIQKEIAVLQAEEQRFQQQLPQIKKNDAYQALLHEIAGVKGRQSDLETALLVLMEEQQTLEGERPKLERVLAEAEHDANTRRTALDAEEARLRAAAAELDAARAPQVPKLPPPTRSRYERIRELRAGQAVMAIAKQACGGCFRGLSPQALQEAKKRDRVLICDGCGRMLVLPPDAD